MNSEIQGTAQTASGHPAKTVCLVGLGNIGSPLASLLARLTDLVGRIILIDGDIYDASNLASQEIGVRDVGKPKVIATADCLRQINPGLEVVPLHRQVEELPRGILRVVDVIVAALDSLRARTFVNEIATRLALPWVDAGVEADGRLVRVSAYRPSSDGPCMECSLSEEAYNTMDQVLPCAGDPVDPHVATAPSTRSPAYLGALAASLAASECERIFSGRWDESLAGRELVMSAQHYTHFVTNLGRNPNCRFDHSSWVVEKLETRPHEVSLKQVLDGQLLTGEWEGADGRVELRVEPCRFVTKTRCDKCRNAGDVLFLSRRTPNTQCSLCGGPMVPQHFYTLDSLAADALPNHMLRRSLADIGLQPGDVFSLSAGALERHFELGA
jgi:molybdopterin/thiamine biosynthesis adenylyltransferase